MTGCILGCAQQGVHFADCMVYDGREYAFPCTGCAGEPTYAGTLVCARCWGRFRWVLREVPDLVGRMRSLIDPRSAMVYEDLAQRTGSGAVEAPAPVPADLIDACRAVQQGLWRWAPAGGWPRSEALAAFADANFSAGVILSRLDVYLADEADVASLYALLLERHEPDEDGVRAAWSVADALARWGAERRETPPVEALTPSRALRPAREFDEDTAVGVPERSDPLVHGAEAAAVAGSLRTLQRWVKAGDVAAERYVMDGRVRRPAFRRSVLVAARDRMQAAKTARGDGGRFGGEAA